MCFGHEWRLGNTRLDALVKNVPRPGGSSDELMKAGLKVLRRHSRCARAHRHRPLDGLSMQPGTLSASQLHRPPRSDGHNPCFHGKGKVSPVPFRSLMCTASSRTAASCKAACSEVRPKMHSAISLHLPGLSTYCEAWLAAQRTVETRVSPRAR